MMVALMTEGSGQLDLEGFHRCNKSQGQAERVRSMQQVLRQLLPRDCTFVISFDPPNKLAK